MYGNILVSLYTLDVGGVYVFQVYSLYKLRFDNFLLNENDDDTNLILDSYDDDHSNL